MIPPCNAKNQKTVCSNTIPQQVISATLKWVNQNWAMNLKCVFHYFLILDGLSIRHRSDWILLAWHLRKTLLIKQAEMLYWDKSCPMQLLAHRGSLLYPLLRENRTCSHYQPRDSTVNSNQLIFKHKLNPTFFELASQQALLPVHCSMWKLAFTKWNFQSAFKSH